MARKLVLTRSGYLNLENATSINRKHWTQTQSGKSFKISFGKEQSFHVYSTSDPEGYKAVERWINANLLNIPSPAEAPDEN